MTLKNISLAQTFSRDPDSIGYFHLNVSLVPPNRQVARWTNYLYSRTFFVFLIWGSDTAPTTAITGVIIYASLLSPLTFQVTKFYKFYLLKYQYISDSSSAFHDPFTILDQLVDFVIALWRREVSAEGDEHFSWMWYPLFAGWVRHWT